MTLTLPVEPLTRLVTAGRTIRDEGDACLDVTPTAIRLRALSNEWASYLDYTIKRPDAQLTTAGSATVWVNTHLLAAFLRACDAAQITLECPADTSSARLVARGGGLTLRCDPFETAHPLLFEDTDHLAPHAVVTVPHAAVARSVAAAALVGDELTLTVHPSTGQVTFHAHGSQSEDAVTYTLTPDHLTTTGHDDMPFTFSLPPINSLLQRLSPALTATLTLTPDYLVYETTPVENATLTLYIAARTKALR